MNVCFRGARLIMPEKKREYRLREGLTEFEEYIRTGAISLTMFSNKYTYTYMLYYVYI